MHSNRLLASVLITSLGLVISVQGGTLFGVSADVNGGGQGCGAGWGYDTWNGGSGGM